MIKRLKACLPGQTKAAFTILLAGSLFMSGVAVANDSVQQLKQKLQQLSSFQANFSQNVTDIDKTVLQQASGKLVLSQPNKLYWELLPPNESVLIADGETVWSLDPFLEQVVAYEQTAATQSNPLILLTDPTNQEWAEFNIVSSMVDGKQTFTITPKVNSGNIEKLSLFFGEKNQLVSIETTDAQFQVSRLTFSAIRQNQPVASNLFDFALPAGYELDDQRSQ
jgi:outer membrane lipoprotein carrier protein